jgi:hypothetical protein
MKNFSAKNVQFTNLSISGEAPVSQGDIGTAPNQIPLNKDLGSLAYMNAPQIEDLNVNTLELREIAAEMSETAVDVFVYDTRRDSDGGAWRGRTQHTSWYNEELNTATRGGRREFPAVAVIVAEADKVTIYDGDDPDLPMWMVFNANANDLIAMVTGGATIDITSVSALNSAIAMGRGTNNGRGMYTVDFLKDTGTYRGINTFYVYSGNIVDRNNARGSTALSSVGIVDISVNDVAMTVLPNAPIDSDTGLPIPTIAVATDGGVSVIKDDGSVVDLTTDQGSTDYAITNHISFTKDNKIRHTMDDNIRFYRTHNIPSSDDAVRHWLPELDDGITFHHTAVYGDFSYINSDYPITAIGEQSIGNGSGLTLFDENKQEPKKSIVAYVNSKYSTGWMPGDIKLATLSDTKIETVGVDETTELLVDGSGNWIGDFNVAADAEAWTISGNGTFTSTGGSATLSDPTPYSTLVEVNVANLIVGKKYILTYTTSGLREAFFEVRAGGANIATTGGFTGTRTGTFSVDFTATDTSVTIRLYDGSGIQQEDIIVSNISVKQTGELITNGTFDNGTTGWTGGNGATIIEDGGKIKITSTTGGNGYAYQQINTIAGRKYIMTFDFFALDASSALAWIGTSAGGGQTLQEGFSGAVDSSRVLEFTATSSVHYIRIGANETAVRSYMFDNISIRLAEDDRSVNNNGLQVFGEITKSPVAPGADLVAYSGFSAENYLMQPYNPDLDFGTGDFSVMFWQKSTTHSGQEVFFDIGQDEVFDNRYIFYRSSGTAGIQFWKRVNGVSTVILDVFDILNVGTYNFIVGTRKDGVFTFYVNGRSVGSISDTSDLTFSGFNRTCIIGNSVNGTSPVQNMALFRISATAPTAEQIARIYRDEKPLFQDGAQATLYGTSDAVTALAYDDSDDLLHVGTASGRSVFNGLKRVDNTTTAVSTAISATEGLVIEQ